MSGLTPDIYTLEDILNPELPEYKLYLFFSPVAITPEQVEAIQKKAYRKGTVVMLVGPTGILPPSDPGNAVYLGNGIAVGHRLESPITLYFPETMNFYDSVTGKKLQSGTQIELDNKPGECKVILYEKPDSSDKVNGR
ncbi:MAG: hypothetical protein PHQ75_09000 [Thermoguttaceae bacterium]|nr:hypothetical protein [Thermoguttaceae bacterium]